MTAVASDNYTRRDRSNNGQLDCQKYQIANSSRVIGIARVISPQTNTAASRLANACSGLTWLRNTN